MATKQSPELRLNKTFSDSARAASAKARQAKAHAHMSDGAAANNAYAQAKSGGEGGTTPGQRDSQRRAAHDAGPMGDAAIKRRAEQESLIAPEFPGVKEKQLSTADAIRKYGFEHPKTIAAAKREDAAKPKGTREEMYNAALDRVKKEAKAELMKAHGQKLATMKEASKKAFEAAGHAKKNGASDAPKLAAAAKASYQAEKRAKAALEEAINNHPRVKEFMRVAKGYMSAKAR